MPMTAPAPIFEHLPGVETPVADLRHALAAVWDSEPEPRAARGKPEPSEFRASQMNLVVHFGLDTTPELARAGFDTALSFSRRYPCRIIALCPRPEGGLLDVGAKIFCECYVGSSHQDMTCTEAIILSYPLEQRAYLEDQASILIESDLPVFYWPQHINRASRLGDYRYFLKHSQRIVIDTAIEKPDVASFAWPRPEIVRDLAWGRTLPVRQSMGHFLSYIAPERLGRGLQRVELRHRPEFAAESRALREWIQRGLQHCAGDAKNGASPAAFEMRADATSTGSVSVRWDYGKKEQLSFHFDFPSGAATLESTLDCEPNRVSSTVRLLPPEKALAEVLFF
jgi:hypothetical protein